MTPIATSAPSVPTRPNGPSAPDRSHGASRRGAHARSRASRSPDRARSETPLAGRPISRYTNAEGRLRELVARPGNGDSVLVIDRDAATLCDRRLLAHIAPDEPMENIALVCRLYLEDELGRHCRRVEPDDLKDIPFGERRADSDPDAARRAQDRAGARIDPDSLPAPETIDRDGCVYRLARHRVAGSSTVELRWSRLAPGGPGTAHEAVSLRDVVGALESYEPACTLTARALASHREDPSVSLTRLGRELERMRNSSIILNRGLREAVLRAIESGETSISEIARRCGMVKRDAKGKRSGETSWVARRVGIMPEGGERAITPWIHSEVLGLIARLGLGVSPREVEL